MIGKLSIDPTIETTKILKKSIQTNRALARLNGTAKIIPKILCCKNGKNTTYQCTYVVKK